MNSAEMVERAIRFYSRPETGLAWVEPISEYGAGKCLFYVSDRHRDTIGCLTDACTAIALNDWSAQLDTYDLFSNDAWTRKRFTMPEVFKRLLPEDILPGLSASFLSHLQNCHDDVIRYAKIRRTTIEGILDLADRFSKPDMDVNKITEAQLLQLEKLLQEKREILVRSLGGEEPSKS